MQCKGTSEVATTQKHFQRISILNVQGDFPGRKLHNDIPNCEIEMLRVLLFYVKCKGDNIHQTVFKPIRTLFIKCVY